MDHEANCQRDGCRPLPAVPRIWTVLKTGERLRLCRKHKAEVARENAAFIGHCEYEVTCDRKPITMALPLDGGAFIAVCRPHNSTIREQYARMRTEG